MGMIKGEMNHGAIELVAATAADAEAWYGWRLESEAVRFNPMDELSLVEVRERLGVIGNDLADESFEDFRWMVRERIGNDNDGGDWRSVGTVSLSVDWKMLHADVGYHIGAEFFGRGIGSAAARLLIEKAFAPELKIARLFAFIAAENAASIRLIERVGFLHEGTMRDHFRIGGEFVTQEVYGLLRSEWSVD